MFGRREQPRARRSYVVELEDEKRPVIVQAETMHTSMTNMYAKTSNYTFWIGDVCVASFPPARVKSVNSYRFAND